MKIKPINALRRIRVKRILVVEVLSMTAQSIAEYFVSRVDEDAGDSISNLKLQKLIYYAQGFHLAIYGKPLFPEKIKAWEHGPVVPQVYHHYRDCGSSAIPVKSVNLNDYTPEIRELLDEVNTVYGQFSASKLREMTHQEPPWKNTPQSETISHELMTDFFKTLVIEDEEGQEQHQEAARH